MSHTRFSLSVLLGALFLATFAMSTPLQAASEGVAKVIILKGDAKVTGKDGKSQAVAKDMWIQEGSKIKTEKGGFTKLLFIDKSTINVGPSSEMEIASFPKSEAGVLNVLSGSIRSQVTKNYMDNQDKDKSKLFIKTKTAAMGVRGTDFVVGFNPDSGATSLDVIHGAVAMAKIDDNGSFDQSALEKAVSGADAVMVEKGFKSDISINSVKPQPPVKIPEADLNKLKSNENSVSTSSTKDIGSDKEEKKAEAKEEKKAEKEEKKEAKADAPKDVVKTEPKGDKNGDGHADNGKGPSPASVPDFKTPDGPAPEPEIITEVPTTPDVPEYEPEPNGGDPCLDYGICQPCILCTSPDAPLAGSTVEAAIVPVSPTSTVNFNISAP